MANDKKADWILNDLQGKVNEDIYLSDTELGLQPKEVYKNKDFIKKLKSLRNVVVLPCHDPSLTEKDELVVRII